MTALRKVLVVDDDPVVRKSFDRVLSSKGYAVITAASGEEALNKLEGEKYDIVYSDIRMPGVSGLELAETVKARRPWTPVVIITGYGTDAAEARAKAAGVERFLHKPLSPEMIEGSAREMLAEPAPAPAAAAIEPAPAKSGPVAATIKNIALFLAAPFIGLAYMVVLPFYGLAMLAALATRVAARNKTVNTVARHVAMAAAAPFIGLAGIVLFPFIGLGLLLWTAGKAVTARA
jgi:CheY-like chemotaxis protein